jgi:hypothetical protein
MRLPRVTTFTETTEIAQVVQQFVLALEELHTEARRYVEGDMAVHQPRAGIVGLERQNDVAFGRQRYCISANGVVELEAVDIAGPCFVFGDVEDVEIVAV